MSKSSARPCVILQNDIGNINSSNTIVAPITHNKDIKPYLVPISQRFDKNGNLILDGKVNVTNIVCVSKARLGDPIRMPIISLSKLEIEDIDKEIAKTLNIIHYYNDIKNKYDKRIQYIECIKNERNKAQDILKRIKTEIGNASFSPLNPNEIILMNIKNIIDNITDK